MAPCRWSSSCWTILPAWSLPLAYRALPPADGGNLIGSRLGKETKIRDYFNDWHFYPDNPGAIYITSGPEIENWCYTGPRDYEGNTARRFRLAELSLAAAWRGEIRRRVVRGRDV